MFENPFVLKPNEYKRDIDVLRHYVEDQTLMLQLRTGKDRQWCEDLVRRVAKERMVDPEVYYLERGDNGDREKKKGRLTAYIGNTVRAKELLAPTFTTYHNPKKKQSLLVNFIDGNVAARSKAKKAMFTAQQAGDKPTYTIKKIEQTNRKLSNNSVSGAHVDSSNPLSNKTGHSTLTSNCRTTSGYGNANNEKFLSGNRHYFHPDIVRNNIISICKQSDYVGIERVMAAFNIVYPSVEQVMEMIEYSARLYWTTHSEYADIRDLVSCLTPLQRAAFVYTGDLYWLMKFNDSLARDFVGRLSTKMTIPHDDPDSVFKTAPDDQVHLASQICEAEMRGKDIKKISGSFEHALVAATVVNIQSVITEYSDLIRTFWVTANVPASVAHFPDSIRRAALTSDTDSTIFTVQDWVIWYGGKIGWSERDNAISATMIFLAAQTITHVLARMSANFGIEEKRIHQVAMKNEFAFPVFVPTQVAKHYYALISVQEGNVFAEYGEETKGVHLKNSNAPRVVMAEAKKMMRYIMDTVMKEGSISINYILKWIADIERQVIDSISKGSYEYFRIGQIQMPDAYKKSAEESPYQYYTLWEEVFAPKYGNSAPPPFMSVKVPTELATATKTKEWLAGMEDRELAARMENWLTRNNKKALGTILLPDQCISSKGIPKEILDVVGVRKIVLDSTKVFYLILETLGIYLLNKKTTRLVSDEH